MPFSFPSLWPSGSVWSPKTDLNPVPIGQSGSYWAAAESNFVSSSLVSVSSSLSATEADLDVLSASLGLASDPTVGWSYTASYSSSLLVSELWNDAGTGNRIKEVGYGYSGARLTSSVATVYAASDGTTVLAQATSSLFYSGSFLTSATLVRTV